MKKLLIFTVYVLLIMPLNAQSLESILKTNNPSYKDVEEFIQKEPTAFAALTAREKKEFMLWEWYWRTRVDSSGSFSSIGKAINEYNISLIDNTLNNSKSAPTLTWEVIGPYSRPSGSDRTIGRGLIRSIYVDKNNTNIIFAGGNNGGIWKTTNGGVNWENITEGFVCGGVTHMEVHPLSSQIMYFSTHVRPANGTILSKTGQYNLGIWRTFDGGANWSILVTSVIPTDAPLKCFLMDPTNQSIFYVLSSCGLYKSTDAGANWFETDLIINEQVNFYLEQMRFKPGDSNTIYVSGANALYKSTDGGINFYPIINNLSSVFSDAQIAIDVDINNPDYLYAFYANRDKNHTTQNKLETSTNEGVDWLEINNQSLTGRHYCIGIWVSPDSDVFAGGVEIHKSSDGGNNFGDALNLNLIHADIRDVDFDESNPDHVWVATDGGVYYSENDGTNWNRITGDIAANEFYSVGITKNDPEIMVAGAHDCGSYYRDAQGNWQFVTGGDGGISLLDQTDDNCYYTTANRSVHKSKVYTGISLDPYDGPIYMNPINSNTLFWSKYNSITGKYELKKSEDRLSDKFVLAEFADPLIDMSICESDSQIIYATTKSTWTPTKIFKSIDGGYSWSECDYDGIEEIRSNTIATGILVNPFDPSQLWITFGGFSNNKKIYFSDNSGISWSNKSEGLPNFPVQSFEYDFLNGYMYVGLDVGLFYKSISDTEWNEAIGFPRILVTDININRSSGDLVVSTYGRGIYRANIGGGYCEYIDNENILINSNTTWDTDMVICKDIVIGPGATLTVSSNIILSFLSTITIMSNSSLIVDGGTIENANIIAQQSNSHLKIDNGGSIIVNYNDEISIGGNATFEIDSGEIINTTIQ